MAGPNGLENATWDSASCVTLRYGSTKVPVLKFTPPKSEVKKEKIARVGEMLAQKHSVGRGEIGNATAEVLLSDYMSIILPRWPKHGATITEFVITMTVTHPSVKGSYSMYLDGCSFVVDEGPELDGSEKGLVKKLEILVMNKFEKGEDNQWKALNQLLLPSSQMAALLKF